MLPEPFDHHWEVMKPYKDVLGQEEPFAEPIEAFAPQEGLVAEHNEAPVTQEGLVVETPAFAEPFERLVVAFELNPM